jgi:hypothetical protein
VVFSSSTFLFFFLPCVLGLYYLSPMRARIGGIYYGWHYQGHVEGRYPIAAKI